ncbi:MAG TPA: serine/threonine-protein kinase, partial [Longimicrobiales bacterium]|nr:serine/threonine-protein kinase [Longimicrobiales bacterium]
GERQDFVERACGGDASMAAAVRSLLAAHDRSGGMLEQEFGRMLLGSAAPRSAGPYRIGRELGRGGMGAVFLAERADGQFHRRVAIKLIDTPADPALHARLVAERQILAALEHPHIARLLDGGVTADGHPFLAMEYVEGLPIDVFCDRMRLNVRARLRLFLQVVHAVEHAHRNLIVHRDLKPSNILVTAGGMVKLLDFGIAKLLNPMLSPERAADTQLERRVFTPEYASPEQLRGEAVNTTSDVYSLGVLLYRLLTGTPPYEVSGRTLPELLHEVGERDPERPSARVRRLLEQDARAAEAHAHARDTTPTRLARVLTGDLDAIVMHALRKEPPHRYGSAELLAQDIERYVDGRPVHARQGSQWYRVRKLTRRHRAQVSAALLGVVALLSGAGVAIWQAGLARAERDRAAAALAQTQEISDFLVQLFETGSPEITANPQVTAQDLVQRGVLRAEDLAGQPAVQARMFGVLGRVQQSLGHYAEARRLSERAVALHLASNGEDEVAGRLLMQLGIQLRFVAEYDSARRVVERARDVQQRLDPAHPDLGETLNQLRSLAIYQGDVVEGERVARSAYDFWRGARGDTAKLAIDALVNYAAAQRRRGDLPGAAASLRSAIALRARAPAPHARELANDRMLLAEMMLGQGGGDEVDRLYAEVAELERRQGPDFDDIRTWLWGAQATRAEQRGDIALAERLLQQSLELRRRKFGEEHPTTIGTHSAIAGLLGRSGRTGEAERLYQSVLDSQIEHHGPAHPVVAGTLTGMVELYLRMDRIHAADSLLERAIRIREALISRTSPLIAMMLADRAMIQLRLGDFEHAERLLQRALPVVEQQLVPHAQLTHSVRARLDTLYTAWGRPEDALRYRAP